MKIKFRFIGLLALLMFTSGCTSFGGFAKAEKPNSYYLTTTGHPLNIFFTPHLYYCTSDVVPTKVECEYVNIEYK